MSRIVNSLDRGLQILLMVEAGEQAVGATDVADALGIDRSSAYRLLATLQARGFVRQLPSKKYALGWRCITLGGAAAAQVDLMARAKPVIRELAHRTGTVVHLARLFDDRPVYVEQVRGGSVITLATEVGQEAYPHCTASGKAIFAYLPSDEVGRYYASRELVRFTPNTVTDLGSLELELQEVRELGWADDNGERYEGVRCVAAPLFDRHSRVVGSISVSGTFGQMKLDRMNGLRETVVDAAGRVSARLGYAG